jgi:hypothetical protein
MKLHVPRRHPVDAIVGHADTWSKDSGSALHWIESSLDLPVTVPVLPDLPVTVPFLPESVSEELLVGFHGRRGF